MRKAVMVQDRSPPLKFKITNILPASSYSLRLKIPMMHLCGPQKSTLRPPHHDSHHFSTNWGRTHL